MKRKKEVSNLEFSDKRLLWERRELAAAFSLNKGSYSEINVYR